VEETLGTYTKRLFGVVSNKKLLQSPPDLFCFAAHLLYQSGAYLRVVNKWPRITGVGSKKWPGRVRKLGLQWRNSLNKNGDIPQEIGELWGAIRANNSVTLSALGETSLADSTSSEGKLLDKLLELLAIADEASHGLGLPASKSWKGLDKYEQWVMGNLIISVQLDNKKRTTLCQYVDPALMAVLPKCHTPRSGTTLRSLSHHLALILTAEVDTHWFWAEAGREGFDGSNLNVLVLPWPLEINPRRFRHSTPRQGPLLSMPTDFGFFEYEPSQAEGWIDKIESLIKIANDRIGDVDLIVLPELALNKDQLKSLAERLSKQEFPPMIVAGTLLKQAGHHFCRNVCATLTFNKDKEMKKGYVANFQDKHHRWRLDPKQVKQYGLGAQLSPSRHWWEGMEICSRTLKVFALKPWLTLCTLICEDLARPEPIADTVGDWP
jgi:hypothetical protein